MSRSPLHGEPLSSAVAWARWASASKDTIDRRCRGEASRVEQVLFQYYSRIIGTVRLATDAFNWDRIRLSQGQSDMLHQLE